MAHCAGDQGKYWEAHPVLLQRIPPEALVSTLGLDSGRFQQCVESGKYAERVRQGVDDGQKLGVGGTPMFFFGRGGDPARFRPVHAVRGAHPYPVFREAIEKLLAGR
jgi:predicted DsbA family dithiol-disulfide isomerase